MLRWQQAEGKRHALEGRAPNEGGSFRTLCGAEVTVRVGDVPELGGVWLDPTCWDCDAAWRRRENIPQYSRR
ncbi:zinc finger protein [Amycolatopsis aidingensis]|uniref:zinc finger protein n=1 Tax=Amycolatopsis aidingensis TaxID=2842453 RepID=UPI001C0E0A60|nr:zinc finger protein [Amycolatopsis aidingensis]